MTVTTCGRICFERQKINLSQVFAGQNVGIKQVSEDYDLGYFDDETWQARTGRPSVRTKSVTHVSGMKRVPCGRNRPK